MLQFTMLEELFDELSEEDQDELLSGYKESFPERDKVMLLSAMVDNAADSIEVEIEHLNWILSHLPHDKFLVEEQKVQDYDQLTSIR